MMNASYAKLPNGLWGIRVHGVAAVGEKIRIEKKDGSAREAVVYSVLWCGNAKDGRIASLVTVEPVAKRTVATIPQRSGMPCGYPGCNPPAFCDECEGEGK
jgi:hypothetical protein